VFSGAVGAVRGEVAAGDIVRIASADGRFLAWAGCSPVSQIFARVWSFREEDQVDARFVAARMAEAIAWRDARFGALAAGRARRIANAEADGLPGCIVDVYASTAVMQLSAAAADRWRDTLAGALLEHLPLTAVVERSDAEVRELEGLPPRVGALRGAAPGHPLEVIEPAAGTTITMLVDVARGHKTGMYLDQAANRAAVAALAAGRRVLNCFAYTGGFSLACLRGGASEVVSIESAAEAVALARLNEERNGVAAGRSSWITGDVFGELRRLRDARRRFDLIVLDPPKFAPTQGHVDRAARAYKDINLLALKLLEPGGLLATFSCSSAVDAALFRQIVAGAAEDAGADAFVRGAFGAAPDHPVRLAFPEGEYLKGLLLERL